MSERKGGIEKKRMHRCWSILHGRCVSETMRQSLNLFSEDVSLYLFEKVKRVFFFLAFSKLLKLTKLYLSFVID